jgi:hypothetical protein
MNDQETEKSALCSEVGESSQMGANRKKKKEKSHEIIYYVTDMKCK